MRYRTILISTLVLGLCAPLAFSAGDYDTYGGWVKIKGEKTGYFHTQQIGNRWWLIDPEGNAFYSKGVDNVSFAPESDNAPKAPADTANWATDTVRQLKDWNFNTAGAWSASQLYGAGIVYAPIVGMASAVQRDVWLKGGVVDFFSPEFRDAADRAAARVCGPHAKDPWLLGYFTDNELRWGKDWRSGESLLDGYLKMAEGTAGFHKASEFMKSRGQSREATTADDASAFLELVAAEYGRVTQDAIRRHDPNHLILGCRFASYPGDGVVRGIAPYFDIVSLHSYNAAAPVDRLKQVTEITHKPAMITEFSFKAADSGLPNTKGAGKPVPTQEDRAKGFAGFVEALAALPACVGFHWFEYRDEPQEGRRLDGENSNFGIVKIDLTPWEVLTKAMQQANGRMETLHAESRP